MVMAAEVWRGLRARLRVRRVARSGGVRGRLSTLALVAAVLGAAAAPGWAGEVPGTPFRGPQYYFTTDMNPVSVTLEQGPPGLSRRAIELPRAFFYFVSGYEDPPHDELPGEMTAPRASLYFTFDGQPLSVAAVRLAGGEGITVRAAVEALREEAIFGSLSASRSSKQIEENFGRMQRRYHEGPYDRSIDLQEFYSIRVLPPLYFGDFRTDEFILIKCVFGGW